MRKFHEYNFAGKRALVRVDFNVPLDTHGDVVTDTTRIERAAPTIQHIVSRGGRVVLLSHLGRTDKPDPAFSLRRIQQTVESIVGKSVAFCPSCFGAEAEAASRALHDGDILLLENVRFHPEEKGKGISPESPWQDHDPKTAQVAFARALAACGDCYVNDAFGAAHRAHASTALLAAEFPNDRMFGLLMEGEITALDRVLHTPERPLTAILGGAKVSDKIPVLERLLSMADRLIIGGGMAYTFLKAQGGQIGNSLYDPELEERTRQLLASAKAQGKEILLPVDTICGDSFSPDAQVETHPANAVPDGWMGLDIGPQAVALFREAILTSKTVLWNGPMGVFEMEPFASGTFAVARALAEATARGTYTLIGGGDSVAALGQCRLQDTVSYVSTGGGAMLEYMEGKVLPGIAAIQNPA